MFSDNAIRNSKTRIDELLQMKKDQDEMDNWYQRFLTICSNELNNVRGVRGHPKSEEKC